jgi:hypothetical protein
VRGVARIECSERWPEQKTTTTVEMNDAISARFTLQGGREDTTELLHGLAWREGGYGTGTTRRHRRRLPGTHGENEKERRKIAGRWRRWHGHGQAVAGSRHGRGRTVAVDCAWMCRGGWLGNVDFVE